MSTEEDKNGHSNLIRLPQTSLQYPSVSLSPLALDTQGALTDSNQSQGRDGTTSKITHHSPSSPLSPSTPTLVPPSPPFWTHESKPRSSGDIARTNDNGNNSASSTTKRRPSLPDLLGMTGISQPATAIKAAVLRNTPSPGGLFKSKKNSSQRSHDYGLPIMIKRQSGITTVSTHELASSSASTSTCTATPVTSRKLNAKKSITTLLRKAANGLNSPTTIMNKIENRRRSSSSVSSVSNGSLEVATAIGANRSGAGRKSFSQQSTTSQPPISAFLQRKNSSPTPSLLSRTQLHFDDDLLDRQHRKVTSHAGVSTLASVEDSNLRSPLQAPLADGDDNTVQSDLSAPLAPSSPLPCLPSIDFDRTPPTSRGFSQEDAVRPQVLRQTEVEHTSRATSSTSILPSDQPGPRAGRSNSNPHLRTRALQILPMSSRSTTVGTMDSLTSVEAQESLLLNHADQFALEGAAPIGSGGETITLAQQLIAVGEALALERGYAGRTRHGRGTYSSEGDGSYVGYQKNQKDMTTPTMTTAKGGSDESNVLSSNGTATMSPKPILTSVHEDQVMLD